MSAEEADELVAGSELLRRVRSERAGLVTGPIDRNHQYWISVERRLHQPPRATQLEVGQFNGLLDTDMNAATTKPSQLGLFTSTGSPDSFGMWWSYLQEYHGSTLFPEPWIVWHVDLAPGSRVLEISTAAQWLELALTAPRQDQGVIYPDWPAVAKRWDGVHLTLSAIAATQGICIATKNATVAPTYWDVESTLWLQWVIEATDLVGATTTTSVTPGAPYELPSILPSS
jgi:hypothetical protein